MSYTERFNEYDLNNFYEVIICNDSVYGSLYFLKKVFDTLAKKDCDFFGIILSKEIKLHLQSYFCVFKRRVFYQNVFRFLE